MVLKIRLRRMGSKQDTCYRVVVSDSRKTPGSRFVDSIGTYDPRTSPGTIRIDIDKADAWISKGATPSGTVKTLLVKARKPTV
ncbi:MAG: 30S ribosomal protein S16 [Acidobacteria bacterium]|uniref:Small ribosomal subunit protein bS16 n=1 Tax=Candidatus Polarisedimenticola svalbardensis TaxID=2886004 RepID=A0A8J6XYJ7_9BACT|nr:30S ribosomal protein S16 [Candidatus Polarisedimenticola svalbardensis]